MMNGREASASRPFIDGTLSLLPGLRLARFGVAQHEGTLTGAGLRQSSTEAYAAMIPANSAQPTFVSNESLMYAAMTTVMAAKIVSRTRSS